MGRVRDSRNVRKSSANEGDIFSRVRRIEIESRGLSASMFAGRYHSAFKGRGMTFSEVREYQYGDDIRDIDWNVTARFHKPYVKVFEEERELVMMLLIDVSASLNFGTREQRKCEMTTLIAATLAFSAMQNNDKIGVIFFTDKIEKYIPPKKGRKHVLYIIRELLDFKPQSTGTDVGGVMEYLGRMQKRRCTVFCISDFWDKGDFSRQLLTCGIRHDVVGIQVYDPLLKALPDVGLLRGRDAETGREMYVDTSSRRVRKAHADYWQKHQDMLQTMFRQCGVDFTSVATDGDFVKALKILFDSRRQVS